MTPQSRQKIIWAARNELTEYHIYNRVAARVKSPHNKALLEKIAAEEKAHYQRWTAILGDDVSPYRVKIWLYTLLTRLLGLSFGLKFMEKGEGLAQRMYSDLARDQPEAIPIIEDEQRHEKELLGLIDEGFLRYVSSFVLGLNDALVELTGALAGLTLALQDTRLIATVGLITGVAASLAMAASEYLSSKEEADKSAGKAGFITGVAYFFTVIFLITPYLVATNAFIALAGTLSIAILIIFGFTFYTAIAKDLDPKKRFFEMAGISLGVAVLNFFIGYGIKYFLGV